MKADSLTIGKVFSSGGVIHYMLPHFQREYAWEMKDWQTLVKDVFSTYDSYDEKRPPEHFLGTLVVINDGVRHGIVPIFRLVDGQQRLTTISLFLCALGREVQQSHPMLYRRIQRLLINEDEEGDLYFKLLPTTKYGDRESFLAVVSGESPPDDVSSNVIPAFDYLVQQLKSQLSQPEFDPERLYIVLTGCLQVVFIDLDQSERPYEIFESLNYKGKSLTQADLVRNYIAMKLPEERQAHVFEKYWSPIEEMLQERRTVGRSRLGELTGFLRHYLAYHTRILANEEHVYARFRDRGESMTAAQFVAEIETLKRFAGYYDNLLRPENESDKRARRLLRRLNTLEISTAYPFLLYAYELRKQDLISDDEFVEGLRILEIYMVRRFLARESTNYLNKMFPTLSREINAKSFIPSLQDTIVTKNFPSDLRLRQSADTVKLYNSSRQTRQKLGLVLETINRHLSAGSGAFTQLDGAATIEHTMPRTLSDEWKHELGPDWSEDYELLHTLGNLTLVTQEWNSALSNASYVAKKSKLKNHGLMLNNVFFANGPERWDGFAIRERAQFLAEKVSEIWPALSEVPDSTTGPEKPRSVTILGEKYWVSSWRDVAERTAECVIQLTDNFERIADNIPGYFSREQFQSASRQLSNGWWMYVNLSSDYVKRLCQSLIDEAGIPDEEYEIEIW